MSFWDSLKNQLGRNTGWVISNWIYGNKAARRFKGEITYKNTDGGSKGSTGKEVLENVNTIRDEAEIEKTKADITKAKLAMWSSALGLNDIAMTVPEKEAFLEKIRTMHLAEGKKELIDQLSYLESTAISSPQGDLISGDNRNYDQDIRSACIEKIEVGILMLRLQEALQEAIFFEKKIEVLNNQRRRRANQQILIWVGIGLLILILITVGIMCSK